MADSLSLSSSDKALVRLAALLHDIGHGPFSHVSEVPLELYSDRGSLGDRIKRRETIHELVTQDMIRNDPQLRHIIGEGDIEKITKLLSRGYGEPVLHSIVSGPLDADKQDYLLRDSYFCGVSYGVFDQYQLHRVLRSIEDPKLGKQLMISPDGINALEQFILAKYYLTTQVYRHKVRMITDEMLLRAIRLGVEVDNINELHQLYEYDGSPSFIANYSKWDDARFILFFCDARFAGTRCHELLTRLHQRRLFKRIYEKPLEALSGECRDPLSRMSEPQNKTTRDQLERRIAEIIRKSNVTLDAGGDNPADFLIVHAHTTKSVREHTAENEASILVDRRPTPKPFEEESLLFRSINQQLNEARVEVYGPVSYDTQAGKRDLLITLEGPITQGLEKFFREGADAGHA